MNIRNLAVAAIFGASALALGEEKGSVYRFGTDAKHTNISFVSEADIENIYGMTHTASGRTWIDFDALEGKCNVVVPVKDLDTGIVSLPLNFAS